jgi:hypothetical protein
MSKRIILLLLIALSCTGCAERVRTPRVLPEWGRAALIGAASCSTPVSLAVSSDGARIVMAWPAHAANTSPDYVHLFALDADGKVVIDHDMTPSIPDLHSVQLLIGTSDAVHLLWSAGEQNARTLWYAPLGEVTPSHIASLDAEPVSPSDQSITWYKAALLPDGDILILWLETHGDLSGQLLSQGETQKLLSGIVGADFQIDTTGNIYLVWSQQETATQLAFYRAQLASDSLRLTSSTPVTTINLTTRARISDVEGPVLTLDHQYAYVNWVQREAYSSQVIKYLHTAMWALNGMAESEVMEPLTYTSDFPPLTTPVSGYYNDQYLAAPITNQGERLNIYQKPVVLNTQERETVIAVSVQYTTRTRAEYQPTLVYMQDGNLLGYQALTWTDHPSTSPVIVTDARRNLYATWTDTTGAAFHYPVYFATTAPALRATWQHVTLADYATIAWDYINRIASGIVLFPFVVVWFFPPLAWLFYRLARGGDLYGQAGQRLLLSAFWLYWAAKYLLTFQILTYVPGLRYVASNVGVVLILCVPLLTLAFSIVVGGLLTIRWTNKAFSVMRTFLLAAAIDALLSFSVYAVGCFE